MPLIENPASPVPGQLQGLHLFHYDGAPCAQWVRFALVHDGRLYLESLDIIEYLDETFGGTRLVPSDPEARAATLELVAQAESLHRSIRYVSFRWGLGRLAMLNPQQRQTLAELAGTGGDGERLVSFYQGFSTGGIAEDVYLDHLRLLFEGFAELDARLRDGRQFLMGDDISIADPFWSMKVLRMIECGYPIETYHSALFAWYQRVYQRTAFQNEVMGKNRLSHHLFRAKAGFEKLLGKGLGRAVQTVSIQAAA